MALNNHQPENDLTKVKSTSLRKMECLECKIVVFPPVMQCKYWHTVCKFCRERLDTCPDPDCGESIESAIRSSVAEKFLEKYVLRCKYFKDGTACMEAYMKEDADLLQAHESICHFREVKCLVPGCYKYVRYTHLTDHFDKLHVVCKQPPDKIQLQTSQLILTKEILNEVCGDRACKSAVAYTVTKDCIFLAIFRMNSLRLPVFEISSIVHPYYPYPNHPPFRCTISASNEEDSNAAYSWSGPVSQTFPLTPILNVKDESAKLKWMVSIQIHNPVTLG